MAFGLAGLSETWLIMAGYGHASRDLATALAALSGLVWLIVLGSYLRYALSDPAVLKRDLFDPIASPFLSAAVITPMLLAVAGITPYAPELGKVLFDVFTVPTFLLGAFFIGDWIYTPLDIDKVHPGYFLPTVAGGLIASDGAALTGQHLLAEAMFGLGVISWLVVGSIILGRLFTRPQLPAPLIPTLAIEVAPAAVASLAYFDAHGDRITAVTAFLAGYGLLMVVAQIRLLPAYLRLRFMPSFWAFTFSWAAVASAAIHWLQDLHPAGYLAWEYVVAGAISILVAAVAGRTLVALWRRRLLPPATTPAPVTLADSAVADGAPLSNN
jgi:tellurite resistance protein